MPMLCYLALLSWNLGQDAWNAVVQGFKDFANKIVSIAKIIGDGLVNFAKKASGVWCRGPAAGRIPSEPWEARGIPRRSGTRSRASGTASTP